MLFTPGWLPPGAVCYVITKRKATRRQPLFCPFSHGVTPQLSRLTLPHITKDPVFDSCSTLPAQ